MLDQMVLQKSQSTKLTSVLCLVYPSTNVVCSTQSLEGFVSTNIVLLTLSDNVFIYSSGSGPPNPRSVNSSS